MGETVYLLCGIASLICVLLLGRAFFRTRARILLWSTLCFVFLFINNVLLFFDVVIFPGPDVDLRIPRGITYIIAMILLVFGLIWDAD